MQNDRHPALPVGGSWRRRLRLSLRATMAAVFVLAVALAWPINRANVQRKAVAAIQKSEPRVRILYDYHYKDGVYVQKASNPGPSWLRGLVGDEFFQDVDSVSIIGPVGERELEPLGRFDRLRILNIFDTSRMGGDMAVLGSLRSLERLTLHNPAVNDAWLKHVEGFGALRHLSLEGTSVTDAGLRHVAPLTGLESLAIAGLEWTYPGRSTRVDSRVTDAGLAPLARLRNLTMLGISQSPHVVDLGDLDPRADFPGLLILNLSDTSFDDRGLAKLSGAASLRILFLSSTRISDAGLAHLVGMPGLRQLYLKRTGVTDAGLTHLPKLVDLEQLDLEGTEVTQAGVDALRRALPKLRVFYRAKR